ncbi:hypothetical protein R3P38DRAFT_1766039 [Favolaschia claudopus]|uniref:Secreted protein n=1 Tax=Favolaschia claudopus TaxID=2862362 RepID=A0AAW0DJM2_9AGAR
MLLSGTLFVLYFLVGAWLVTHEVLVDNIACPWSFSISSKICNVTTHASSSTTHSLQIRYLSGDTAINEANDFNFRQAHPCFPSRIFRKFPGLSSSFSVRS